MSAAEIVVGLLKLVATIAPGVLAAITSRQTDEEAIQAARAAAQAVPLRLDALDADLAERKRRG